MKAVILCAGRPEQRNLTAVGTPKPLVPLGSQPALGHLLDRLEAAGIRQAVAVVASRQGPVAGWQGFRQRPGWRFTFVEQSLPLGTAHAVRLAKDLVGEEPFLVVCGDLFLGYGAGDRAGDLAALVRAHAGSERAATLLVAAGESPERLGVVEMEGGQQAATVRPVRRVVEKPARAAPGAGVLAGAAVVDRRIFAAIDALRPSPRGELELTGALQMLVAQGLGVAAVACRGFFCDLGLPSEVLRAHRWCLDRLEAGDPAGELTRSTVEGRVEIAGRARLIDSHVTGPAVIGAGAAVLRSWVGPYTTVGRLAVVEDSEVEESILLDGCRVRGVARLQRSIVGEGARLLRGEGRPRALRVAVGREGVVELP